MVIALIFVFGFAKNERDNVNESELQLVRVAASQWLAANTDEIEVALQDGALLEIPNE